MKKKIEETNDGIDLFCIILAMLSFFLLFTYLIYGIYGNNGNVEQDKNYKKNFTLIVDNIDIKYINNKNFVWLKNYYYNDGYYVIYMNKKTNNKENLFIHNRDFEQIEIDTLSYCKINFYKNSWYISNQDLKNCSKENSLQAVLKVTQKLNEKFYLEKNIINSWKNNE